MLQIIIWFKFVLLYSVSLRNLTGSYQQFLVVGGADR